MIWMRPKKQRHTARRILARLVDEHGAEGLSYSTVRDHVRKRRPQILAEAGRPLELGYVPQTHEPAAEAEVDFHDLWVILRGVKTKTALFTMRLSYSGAGGTSSVFDPGAGGVPGRSRATRSSAWVGSRWTRSATTTSTARSNRCCSGGPARRTSAGSRSDRTMASRPGIASQDHEGSHEKGGVEGEGGRFRRNHCVPMPVVDSVEELNALLEAADEADDARRMSNRANSVGHYWAFEKTLLRPLPSEAFDTALTLEPRVDRYAQVMVRCNQYSVPARFIGHRVRVKLSASAVTVYDRTSVVARHQRAIGKGAKVLDLDHYLEILHRKPGALPGATALAQARASKVFTAEHDALWAAARKAHGDGGSPTHRVVDYAIRRLGTARVFERSHCKAPSRTKENIMSIIKNHKKSVTAALGAAAAAVAAPAMLFVGAGTAHADGTVWNNSDYLGTTVFVESDGKTFGNCTYNAFPIAGPGIPPGPRNFVLPKGGIGAAMVPGRQVEHDMECQCDL